jgi:electron transport complex protein RnfA
MNDLPLIFFVIFSAFTINLTLQCALGIKGVCEAKNPASISIIIKLGIIFFTVIVLWFFFSKIIHQVISGTFVYVLLFPVSSMVYDGLEFLIFHYILKKEPDKESAVTFPGCITAAAVFICVNIADSFVQAVSLSFGFSAGILLVFLIIGEIRQRAALEKVPQFLRGKPLVLISMGMLSLIFSAVSLLLFRMI